MLRRLVEATKTSLTSRRSRQECVSILVTGCLACFLVYLVLDGRHLRGNNTASGSHPRNAIPVAITNILKRYELMHGNATSNLTAEVRHPDESARSSSSDYQPSSSRAGGGNVESPPQHSASRASMKRVNPGNEALPYDGTDQDNEESKSFRSESSVHDDSESSLSGSRPSTNGNTGREDLNNEGVDPGGSSEHVISNQKPSQVRHLHGESPYDTQDDPSDGRQKPSQVRNLPDEDLAQDVAQDGSSERVVSDVRHRLSEEQEYVDVNHDSGDQENNQEAYNDHDQEKQNGLDRLDSDHIKHGDANPDIPEEGMAGNSEEYVNERNGNESSVGQNEISGNVQAYADPDHPSEKENQVESEETVKDYDPELEQPYMAVPQNQVEEQFEQDIPVLADPHLHQNEIMLNENVKEYIVPEEDRNLADGMDHYDEGSVKGHDRDNDTGELNQYKLILEDNMNDSVGPVDYENNLVRNQHDQVHDADFNQNKSVSGHAEHDERHDESISNRQNEAQEEGRLSGENMNAGKDGEEESISESSVVSNTNQDEPQESTGNVPQKVEVLSCDVNKWIAQYAKSITSIISRSSTLDCGRRDGVQWSIECDDNLYEIYKNALNSLSKLTSASTLYSFKSLFEHAKTFVPLPVRLTILTKFMNSCGFRQRLPDVINIGAINSGTSALQQYLAAHPQIAQPLQRKGEDIHFFDLNYGKGIEFYKSRMGFASDDMVSYVTSPQYLTSVDAPWKMVKDLPRDVKFILTVRDPIERALSEFRHNSERLLWPLYLKERYAFVNATSVSEGLLFQHEMLDQFGAVQSSSSLIHTSLYSKHFRTWRQYFSRDQFLIIDQESLTKNPVFELQRVERFLGLRNFYQPSMFETRTLDSFCMQVPHLDSVTKVCPNRSTLGFLPKPQLSDESWYKLCSFFTSYNQEFFRLTNMAFNWTCF